MDSLLELLPFACVILRDARISHLGSVGYLSPHVFVARGSVLHFVRPSRDAARSRGVQTLYLFTLDSQAGIGFGLGSGGCVRLAQTGGDIMSKPLQKVNHAMEPTPPDLIMSPFVVPPIARGPPRSRRRAPSCFR